jgi:tetratricopeptide (TPR) repeat protein
VRIPLDYYQILGIPESCISELEQAYRDRLDQFPRQEYSDAAIESRKQLIALAYQVLSDPQQRSEYDAVQIDPVAEEVDAGELTVGHAVAVASFDRRPDLEISAEHFLGGLLILFERGEYEEINSICMPYIGNNGRNSNSGSLHLPLVLTPSGNLPSSANSGVDPAVMWKVKRTATGSQTIPLKPDIVLTMAFSLQELGDREWRDGCYEAAVSHFETARKILVQEDLFPQIQGQIERRLDRLRPYRISYLVALPLDQHEQRRQGIHFLEELLERACTNESDCQERFGLNSERTIQFIHETLPHLTAGEQSHLFSQLARDSHQLGANALTHMQLACTYLHVHALIAQGFAYHNPQLIYRAQQILLYRLGQRLDVSIEQAICAVLMGQIEDAEAVLATAPESAAMVVIRQQSQGLPNLLRGLCWYIESWLKDEAFPCFRDLTHNDPSLQNYFSDPDVQDFADRASIALAEQADADGKMSTWQRSAPVLIDVPVSGDLSPSGELSQPKSRSSAGSLEPSVLLANIPHMGGRPSNLSQAWQTSQNQLGNGAVLPAERVGQTPPPPPPEPQIEEQVAEPETNSGNKVIQLERERLRRRPSMPTARTIDGQRDEIHSQEIPLAAAVSSSKLVPASKSGQLARANGTTGAIVRRRQRRKPNIPRILLVGTGGLGVACGAVWLANATWNQFQTPMQIAPIATHSPLPDPPTANRPPARSPSPQSQKPVPVGMLTKDTAQQIVQTWLTAKTKSLGPEYQTAQLKDILVEPALTLALGRVEAAKADGDYIKYQHQVTVASIEQTNPLAPVATIQAQVREDAEYFDSKKPTPVRSTSNTYSVKYNLVRQDPSGTAPNSHWYVKQIDVIR